MLSLQVFCILLVLLSVFSQPIRVPKVRPFRRAGDVDEFVSASRTHTRSGSYIVVVSSYQKKSAEVADPADLCLERLSNYVSRRCVSCTR